jgi:molybdopterin converting factor small subunit
MWSRWSRWSKVVKVVKVVKGGEKWRKVVNIRAQVAQELIGLMEDWAPAEEDEELLQELCDQCASLKEKEASLVQIYCTARVEVTQVNNEVKAALLAN